MKYISCTIVISIFATYTNGSPGALVVCFISIQNPPTEHNLRAHRELTSTSCKSEGSPGALQPIPYVLRLVCLQLGASTVDLTGSSNMAHRELNVYSLMLFQGQMSGSPGALSDNY